MTPSRQLAIATLADRRGCTPNEVLRDITREDPYTLHALEHIEAAQAKRWPMLGGLRGQEWYGIRELQKDGDYVLENHGRVVASRVAVKGPWPRQQYDGGTPQGKFGFVGGSASLDLPGARYEDVPARKCAAEVDLERHAMAREIAEGIEQGAFALDLKGPARPANWRPDGVHKAPRPRRPSSDAFALEFHEKLSAAIEARRAFRESVREAHPQQDQLPKAASDLRNACAALGQAVREAHPTAEPRRVWRSTRRSARRTAQRVATVAAVALGLALLAVTVTNL